VGFEPGAGLRWGEEGRVENRAEEEGEVLGSGVESCCAGWC
jgi:hypothetical protein